MTTVAADSVPAAIVSTPSRSGIPTAVSADLLAEPSKALSALTLTMVALVLGFIGWAHFAVLDEVTQGRGRVIPASKLQVVQNLEGGIVREIHVREGQRVAEGDMLLRIDPTHFDASAGEAQEKILGLKALLARLEAEVEGKALAFPPEVSDRAELASRQRDLYETRKRELEAALAALDQQGVQRAQEIMEVEAKAGTLTRALDIAEKELAISRPLEASRAVSKTELLALEAKANETRGALEAAQLSLPRLKAAQEEVRVKRAEKLAAYRSDSLQKLSQAQVELMAMTQASRSNTDKVARTTVRAPVAGIVKTVNVTTAGQVVQPGSSLVEIVPLNDTLLVEAQVRPQDIAFIHPGQKAKVKITAYDFSLYGGLDAEVERIGVDSVTPERGEPYYPVRVRTDKASLTHRGETLPIMPGMVAEVDILSGHKSVLQYLSKPLLKMTSQAMRER